MSTVNQMLHDLNARTGNLGMNGAETYAPVEPVRINKTAKYIVGTASFAVFAIILITQNLSTYKSTIPVNDIVQVNTQNEQPIAQSTATILASDAVPAAAAPTSQTADIPASATQIQIIPSVDVVTNTSIDVAPFDGYMQVNTSNGEGRFIAGLQDKARLAIQSNNTQSAIQALQALLTAKPYDHASRLLLSRLYFQSNQPDIALNLLQAAPSEDDLSIEFLGFRASLYTEAGEHLNAISDYQVLTRVEPTNVRWQLGIAIAYDQIDAYQDAKFAYEQVKLIGDLPTNIFTFIDERITILKDLI